jgi:hypothetical protein
LNGLKKSHWFDPFVVSDVGLCPSDSYHVCRF